MNLQLPPIRTRSIVHLYSMLLLFPGAIVSGLFLAPAAFGPLGIRWWFDFNVAVGLGAMMALGLAAMQYRRSREVARRFGVVLDVLQVPHESQLLELVLNADTRAATEMAERALRYLNPQIAVERLPDRVAMTTPRSGSDKVGGARLEIVIRPLNPQSSLLRISSRTGRSVLLDFGKNLENVARLSYYIHDFESRGERR